VEWGGEGVATLSVPERGTITNMGTELGATTSIFPSDEITRAFLAAQGREADYTPLSSDPDAEYDRIIDIDILLYGDAEINLPELVVPHPRMHERDFVMKPLEEVRSH
jgi:aconitase A